MVQLVEHLPGVHEALGLFSRRCGMCLLVLGNSGPCLDYVVNFQGQPGIHEIVSKEKENHVQLRLPEIHNIYL